MAEQELTLNDLVEALVTAVQAFEDAKEFKSDVVSASSSLPSLIHNFSSVDGAFTKHHALRLLDLAVCCSDEHIRTQIANLLNSKGAPGLLKPALIDEKQAESILLALTRVPDENQRHNLASILCDADGTLTDTFRLNQITQAMAVIKNKQVSIRLFDAFEEKFGTEILGSLNRLFDTAAENETGEQKTTGELLCFLLNRKKNRSADENAKDAYNCRIREIRATLMKLLATSSKQTKLSVLFRTETSPNKSSGGGKGTVKR